MAVTNPALIRFSNEQIRQSATRLARLYFKAKETLAEWAAQGLASVIPDDPTERMVDGSAMDGRPPIFGSDVHEVIARLTEMVADLEANDSAKLNTILRVAVRRGSD